MRVVHQPMQIVLERKEYARLNRDVIHQRMLKQLETLFISLNHHIHLNSLIADETLSNI